MDTRTQGICNALVEQRDRYANEVVNLKGELAVLREEIAALKKPKEADGNPS